MEMDSQYHPSAGSSGRAGGGGRGRAEALLSTTSSSSDLNRSSSSNSVSLSASLSNSDQHQQRQRHRFHQQQEDPMHSWWESVSKARSRIQILLGLLPPSDSLLSLVDSDHPARSLLDSYEAYSALSSALSGSGDDPLCQWLYDTFLQSSNDCETESDLRLVVLSLVPLIAGLYLSRIHAFSTTSPVALGSPSLAGFEAVLLALYSSETKSRAGNPLLVRVPSPTYLSSHPSLYHTPTPQASHNNQYSRSSSSSSPSNVGDFGGIAFGVISPPLEPQMGIKSTKRAMIVGVAFHCFFEHISQMPPWSKIDLCRFAATWAGDDCPCAQSLDFDSTTTTTTTTNEQYQDYNDDDVSVSKDLMSSTANGSIIAQHLPPHQNGAAGREIILSEDFSQLDIDGENNIHSQQSYSSSEGQDQGHEQGVRIPLPWELLQPLLRILGHCLLAPPPLVTQEIKEVASVAVRRLFARASHDLAPQAILATRSLVQLDNRARAMDKAAALMTASSNATTPKSKKPEVLLVSK